MFLLGLIDSLPYLPFPFSLLHIRKPAFLVCLILDEENRKLYAGAALLFLCLGMK